MRKICQTGLLIAVAVLAYASVFFGLWRSFRQRRTRLRRGLAVAYGYTMFTVYVLKSQRTGRRYIGVTKKLVAERLSEHNHGSNQWTRTHKPFKLLYTERYEDGTKARRRERFLKSGQGRNFLSMIL